MKTIRILLRSAVTYIRQNDQLCSRDQARKPLGMATRDKLLVLSICDYGWRP